MHLSQLLVYYLNWARTDADFRPSTLKTYPPNLRAFLRWLDADLAGRRPEPSPATLDDYTLDTFRRYLKHLKTKPSKNQIGLRPRSILSQFAALHSFSEWMIRNGHLAENPVKGLDLPKKDEVQRPLITTEDVQALLAALPRIYPDRRRLLCSAALRTLCGTALRRQEFLDLTIHDLHFGSKPEDNFITVQHGKGDKRRVVYMDVETAHALNAWLIERKTMGCNHAWLWPCDTRRRMGITMLSDILKEVKTVAGRPDMKGVLCHPMRHAYATHLAEAGVPLKDIQEQLGHSDLKTTQMYLHSNPARRAHNIQRAAWTPTPEPIIEEEKPMEPITPPTPRPAPQPATQSPQQPRVNRDHKVRTFYRNR